MPGRELVRRIKLNELFQSRDQVHAFVDQAGAGQAACCTARLKTLPAFWQAMPLQTGLP